MIQPLTTRPNHARASEINVSRLPPPPAFTLTDTLSWHPDPVDLNALAAPPDPVVTQATDFLRTIPADGPKGPRNSECRRSKRHSHADARPRKARLKIRSFCQGLQSPWQWALPGDTRKPPAPPPDIDYLAPDAIKKIMASIGNH